MPRTRSAKGQLVDFDLLKIRQKLAAQPVSIDVKAREDFIDKKLSRRRMRKVKTANTPLDGTVDSEALVSIETSEAAPLIDPPKVEVKEQSKQKHRPPVKG
jgi:hypothetical protein